MLMHNNNNYYYYYYYYYPSSCQGHMKAYISHKDSLVVLSKQMPFPAIREGQGFGAAEMS